MPLHRIEYAVLPFGPLNSLGCTEAHDVRSNRSPIIKILIFPPQTMNA